MGQEPKPQLEVVAMLAVFTPNNTIMITGQIRDDEDAVYIVDMATERLAAFEFQGKGAAKRLRPLGARDLKLDLK